MNDGGLAGRVARLIVRVAATLAPRGARDRMRAEWMGELDRDLRAGRGWMVTTSALGAFADAWALRRLDELGREGRTMGDSIGAWLDDVRGAVRALLRTPGFTAVTVATLAVGIGGAAAIYSLLDRVVLDPLPYPQPERLVRLENQVPGIGPDAVWQLSTAQFMHYARESSTLDEVGLYRPLGGNVTTLTGPERVRGVRVTASVVRMLGARARLGRVIDEADDVPSAPEVVMLSHDFWVDAMGSDASAVGSTLRFNDVPYEVIGVLEPDVELPGLTPELRPDLWTTLRVDPAGYFGNNHVFPAIGRMSASNTAVDVEAELDRLERTLPEAFPEAYSTGFLDGSGFRTVATPLKEHVLGDLARNLWISFAGIGLVLLIAAANVANLFLVRFEAKRRELAIRSALGAGRSTIVRLLLAEGIVASLIGGVGALAVGYWAIPAMTALAPPELPRVHGAAIDLETIAFTLALSLVVGVVVAVVPLTEALAGGASEGLVEGGRGNTVGRSGQRVRGALVVTQMALALTLVVAAGMLLQSLARLRGTDPGFDPENVVAVDLHLTQTRYPDDVALWAFYREARDRIASLPGVRSVGLGEEVPVSGGYGCTVQGFEDGSIYQRLRDAGLTTCAGQLRVTPGYFEALGLEAEEGRLLEDGDLDDPARASVVVSRAFADRFWPGQSALGQGVAPARTIGPFHHVVGVVGDVRRASDDGRPPLSQDAIAIYYPVVDNPDVPGNWWWWPGDMTLLVRADGVDASTLLPAIRSAIFDVDSEIPVANVRLMEDVVAGALVYISFVSLLLGLAATVALVLAAVGLYGVVSYVVSKRTREIGMRLAIGARPREVESMVVRQTLRVLALGLLVGVPLAVTASRVGSGLIVGVEPTAPVAYLAAAGIMVMITLLAAWLPARRAASIDPVEALRAE